MSEAGETAEAGPGETLKETRLAIDVSVAEVADALNLPSRVVEGIESNEYENLPPPVFTRGYIRAYARLLELDVDTVLAMYRPPNDDGSTTGSVLVDAPLRRNAVQRHTGLVISAAVVAAIGIILTVLYVVWPNERSPDVLDDEPFRPTAPVSSEQRVPAAPTPVISPERSSTVASDAGSSAVPAGVPAEPLDQAGMGASAAAVWPGQVDGTSSPAVQSLRTQDGETPARRITPFGDDLLTFEFTDECWVEVKDLEGDNLYSDLNRAGSELRLVGQAPFRVLLGYAPGAALRFNGEGVPLGPHTTNNVASLVIGQ